MTSVLYDSFLDDISKGNIVETDTFYVMLVTSAYVPNKATHAKRSDVTNEATGTGYTSGGAASTVTYALNTTAGNATWSFADVAWPSSSITAAGGVIYKHRGGAATADNLVAYVDFGGIFSSISGTFTFHATSSLVLQA